MNPGRRNAFLKQLAIIALSVSPAFMPDKWIRPAVGIVAGTLLITVIVRWVNDPDGPRQ